MILVYDDEKKLPFENLTHAEFYAKATEILVTTLSSFTREGNLYRVDLRLRPDDDSLGFELRLRLGQPLV